MYPVLVRVPLGIITISTFHASMATQEEPRVEASDSDHGELLAPDVLKDERHDLI